VAGVQLNEGERTFRWAVGQKGNLQMTWSSGRVMTWRKLSRTNDIIEAEFTEPSSPRREQLIAEANNSGQIKNMKTLRTICSRRRGIRRFSFSILGRLPRAPEHVRSAGTMRPSPPNAAALSFAQAPCPSPVGN